MYKNGFYTPLNPAPAMKEMFSGKNQVSMIGYVPLEKMINALLLAGKRLEQARMGMYDTDDDRYDPEVDPMDPTRVKGFGLEDTGPILDMVMEKAKSKKPEEQKKGNKDEKDSGEGVMGELSEKGKRDRISDKRDEQDLPMEVPEDRVVKSGRDRVTKVPNGE